MVNFGLQTAEIRLRVWGTPANFNGFRVLAALLHGTVVVSVSQTLRRWTEGATYIRQGGHHVGIGPHSSFESYTEYRQLPKDDIVAIFPLFLKDTVNDWYEKLLDMYQQQNKWSK